MKEKIGITQSYYSHIENGTRLPPTEVLEKIAGFFGVRPAVLRKELDKNRPQLVAAMNWIWKIKIGNKSVIDAFKIEKFFHRGTPNKDELILNFIRFIEFNIGNSIRDELKREMNGTKHLEQYLLDRLWIKTEKEP
jgi:transcriptional regulator with XRE-family HTH domain